MHRNTREHHLNYLDCFILNLFIYLSLHRSQKTIFSDCFTEASCPPPALFSFHPLHSPPPEGLSAVDRGLRMDALSVSHFAGNQDAFRGKVHSFWGLFVWGIFLACFIVKKITLLGDDVSFQSLYLLISKGKSCKGVRACAGRENTGKLLFLNQVQRIVIFELNQRIAIK